MPADNELEQCVMELADIIARLDAHGLDLAARLVSAANLAIKMHLHSISAEELELVEFLAELGCTPTEAQTDQDDDPECKGDGRDNA